LRERRRGGKRTSKPLSSLFKRKKPCLEEKRKREEKEDLEALLPLFRGTSDLLENLGEIASFWRRE
jgi:hypothetical protein